MPYREADRYLYLTTPLGEDKLLLAGFSGSEGLSRLFTFHLDLRAANSTTIDFEKLIGQKVSFGIQGAESSQEPRHFHGIVIELSQNERGSGFTDYHMTVVPEVWKFTQKFRSRIFQHMTVPDILKKVFDGPAKVTYQIQGEFHEREYCTQYQESDFAFASRLMEEEGIYYFFKFTRGAHELVLANTPESHPDIPGESRLIYEVIEGGTRDEERISQWQKAQMWGPGKYTIWDHHFELAHKHLDADQTVIDTVQVGRVQHKLKLGGNDDLEIYENPGRYAQRFDAIDKGGGERPSELQRIFEDNKRTVKLRMQQTEMPMLSIHGSSNCRQMAAGHKFTLQRHHNADGQYVFVEVSHHASEGAFRSGDEDQGDTSHYGNTFMCLPYSLPFRPPRATRRPLIGGPQTAVVVGPSGEEIFTDKYGRVKVHFHWDRENDYNADASCWLRVATMWAGKQWGSVFIPRVGHEVIVAFIEGDPDRPIVIGSVYNADTMPPYELPANKTRSGIKSNSSKGSGGFNEIRFEDKKGSEQIFIHGEKDQDIRIENDCREWVGQDRHLIVKRDRIEEVQFDTHIDTKRDHVENVGRDRNVKVAGKEALEVSGSRSLRVSGDAAEQFASNHSEETSGNFYLHARTIVLQADTALTISVGGSNFVSISPAGVNVMGTMVNINSGGSATPGVPCNLVPPASPKAAAEAAKAMAGSEVTYSGGGASPSGRGAGPAAGAAPAAAPVASDAPRHDPGSAEAKEKKHYIEIELRDDEQLPVPGEPYEVILADGSTLASGTTDANGRARVDNIDPGQCRVRFPRRDQSAMKRL
ncbi:MAG: type VI secretion system tip protein VgrG [Acidobacteria bacterium]|nr:MAG: type VI secretion system tip protein VgrG [Acidobacteriota bacterium]